MQIKEDSPRIEKLKKKARRISTIEGSFSTVQSGFGDAYITPFAIALNSSDSQIAMLTSFSGILGPLSQWFGSRIMEKQSRKKIILLAVLLQSLMWIPIIILSLLYWRGVLTSEIPLLLIVFFSVYVFLGNLGGPAWFSWMGDIVNAESRGKYFSWRNRITGIVAIVCTVIAAFFLDFLKKHSLVLVGFAVFFFLAMLSRLIARELFKKKYEPKMTLKKGYYFSFWQFLKKAPFNNFGKFSIFRFLESFSVSIAGPFFAVYMLRNLGFSYVTFMIVILSQTVFSLIVMPLWGRFSDEFGNYEVMKITSILIPAIPLLWLLSPSPYYLIFGPMLVAGVSWAGFNLAAGNFIYDCVTPQKRGIVVSYYNILNGIGVFLGATLGGIIVASTSINFMNIILFVFLISGIARMIVSLVMLPRIKEVRNVEKFDGKRAFKNLILKTIGNQNHEPRHELMAEKTTTKN